MERYIELKKGAHTNPRAGMCIMEAVAWWFGEDHTDYPECVSHVLREYCMNLNDRMPNDVRQRLVPYIPRLAGTAGDGGDQERAEMAAMRAVNVFAPKALRKMGLHEHADACERASTLDEAWEAAGAAYAATDPTTPVYAAAYDASAAYAAANATYADAAAFAANAANYAAYAALWDDALTLLDDMLALGAEKRGIVAQVRDLADAPCVVEA